MRNADITVAGGFCKGDMSFHLGYMRSPPAYEPTGPIHTVGDLHHTSLANVVDGGLSTEADEYATFIRIGGIAC